MRNRRFALFLLLYLELALAIVPGILFHERIVNVWLMTPNKGRVAISTPIYLEGVPQAKLEFWVNHGPGRNGVLRLRPYRCLTSVRINGKLIVSIAIPNCRNFDGIPFSFAPYLHLGNNIVEIEIEDKNPVSGIYVVPELTRAQRIGTMTIAGILAAIILLLLRLEMLDRAARAKSRLREKSEI